MQRLFVILLMLVLNSRAQQPETVVPSSATGIAPTVIPKIYVLPSTKITQILEIRGAQYQSLGDREREHANMLEAEKRMNAAQAQLDSYNAAMARLRNELRIELNCPDCEITAPGAGFVRAQDIQFAKPLPSTIAK